MKKKTSSPADFLSHSTIDFCQSLAYIYHRSINGYVNKEITMKSHTYYDVLGVSRNATLEEITTAKNALAKVYHPDANVHRDIDTTAFMQEILEAYRVLSNTESRKIYDQEVFGETARVFRTFTVGPENNEDEPVSFVTYWNTANQLHEVIGRSVQLMKQKDQKRTLSQRIFRKIGKKDSREESSRARQIEKLSEQAIRYITILKMAGIPMEYWSPDAMNWVLVRWGQKQTMDYHILFSRYDAYIDETKTGTEKMRLRSQNRQFHNNLKKLLSYALEA